MKLIDIYCQDKAIDNLQRAYGCGKVGHAYIFAGDDGVGRFTTAKVWAKLLLCENPVSHDGFTDSCGLCESCTLFDADSHPDFHHVHKELIRFSRKTENRKKMPIDVPIDVIREFLIEKVATRPSICKSKVYVISESEKLNTPSQNALLKVLEEPPSHCYIILLCTKLENLLPTTQSRCQVVRFGSVDIDRVVEVLVGDGVDRAQGRFWAGFTGGSVGQSQCFAGLSDEKVDVCLYELKRQMVRKLAEFELGDTIEFGVWIGASIKKISELWAKQQPDTSKSDLTRQSQRLFIRMVITAFSDAMKAEFVQAEELVNFDQFQEISALSARFGPEGAATRISDCYEAIQRTGANVNEKLIFEHLLINIASSDTIKVW